MLSERLADAESYKKKFKEKNGLLEKQLKIIQGERDKVETAFIQLKKRANDLQVLKSSNNKILDEKIKTLQKENSELNELVKSLKKTVKAGSRHANNNHEEEDDEEE